MRSLALIAVSGTLVLAGGAYAQSLTEHAAAAGGATIGTAAGKPISNAISGIFGQVDKSTATAADTNKVKVTKTTIPQDKSGEMNRGGAPGSFSPGFVTGGSGEQSPAQSRSGSQRRAGPLTAAAPAIAPVVAIAPPVKEPSLEEVSGVKLGTTQKDLFTALGTPESHVTIPDQDGHLLESCQYWAKGKQLGIIRLDNGQVVKVEVRADN